MSRDVATSSNVAAWTFMLVATLWSVSATMPAGALTALTVVGVTATWAVLALARRPEPKLAQVRPAVHQGRTA
jgi:hypothetical protein